MIRALLQEWKDQLQGGFVALMLVVNHSLVSDTIFHTFFKLSRTEYLHLLRLYYPLLHHTVRPLSYLAIQEDTMSFTNLEFLI